MYRQLLLCIGVKRYQDEQVSGKENNKETAPEIENIKATTSKPLPLGTENIATSLHGQKKEWIDPGYVDPVSRNTEAANLAFLDAKNYDGLKHLTVDFAKIYLEHELPVGYSIIRRIGKGAFGCCFLIEKKLETVAPNRGNLRRTESMADEDVREGTEDNRYLQLVLKVVVGGITPRRPVMFYKSCSEYTLMISHKAIPLKLDNLKFIIGILKYRHTEHGEVHGDLHPGNMMYFPKDVTLEMWNQQYNLRSTWEKCTHASHIVQARLDFIDHWFSMKDEQTTNIIDADIGGKIGEAKIIVNHQHHEPRNRTWQVSDLIGLMNWVYKVVILQSGHSLSSHDKRGIVYQITFKSLKMLYKHITDLYDALDSKFIFTSVFATVEPFGLQLEPGCCYLDELLEGQFLEFQRFKGSYSLASSADGATSCVKMIVPTVVQAVPMSQSKVYETFRQLMSDALFLSTLGEVLKLLVDPCIQGGVIFLIVDKVYKDKLKIQALDKNALTEVCRQHAIRVFDPSFKHILSSFCAHSGTDRWEAPLLQDLENALKNESQTNEPRLVSLRGQPKDGAFVLSHKGTILAAASRLEHLAPHLALLKVDGTRVGTRHAAALGVAEWMRSERIYGAVFVKSDAGSVHVMIPDHDEEVPRIAALVDD